MRDAEGVDSDDEDACLSSMLGGLSLSDIGDEAWENQSQGTRDVRGSSASQDHSGVEKFHSAMPVLAQVNVAITSNPAVSSLKHAQYSSLTRENEAIYSQAHCVLENGSIAKPKVQVVDLSHLGRGNALVSTQSIPKGNVIFTERAACCVSVEMDRNPSVRYCQNCFRSMEPIPSNDWPMPHLWPTLPFTTQTNEERDQCDDSALFCSKRCREAFRDGNVSSFANVKTTIEAVKMLYASTEAQLQPAVLLGIRMFSHFLWHFRSTHGIMGSTFDGLCGCSTEVQTLELGIPVLCQGENEFYRFQLEPVYQIVAEGLLENDVEREVLCLHIFEECCTRSARNGFAFRTRSPFQDYYECVIRTTGRSSETHETLKRAVARHLGRYSLDRDMDKQMDEQLTPALSAIFVLAARINHSCCPNAQVQSQVFVDNHIDLIAIDDIAPGEEITISYLPPRPMRRATRQRQLRARYLFHCSCPGCKTNNY